MNDSLAEILTEVEPQRRADCAIDEITAARRKWERQNRRPAALTPREALMVLEFESTLVSVAAENLAAGETLSESDRSRLQLAHRRITTIVDEVAR